VILYVFCLLAGVVLAGLTLNVRASLRGARAPRHRAGERLTTRAGRAVTRVRALGGAR